MRFSRLRVECDGLAAGCVSFLQVVLGGVPVHVKERRAVRHARISPRVARVNHDCAGKHLSRKLEALAAVLVEELATAQVVIVGLDVGGGRLGDGALLRFCSIT